MRPMGPSPKITLPDLITLDELQELQESFADVANVGIRVVDADGRPVTRASHMPVLCGESLQDTPLKKKVCGHCLPTFLGGRGIVDDDLSFECIPGLKNFLVPLRVPLSSTRSLIVGYMVLGPAILARRKTREEFDAVARELGAESDELWNLILELRVFSYKGIRSFIDMIENVMGRIFNLAYGKLVSQKKAFARLLPQGARREVSSVGRVREFLELLLDLVIEMTSGSIGSVMVFDEASQRLRIGAAHGLSDEVVRKTSVKLGEGVAGLAAQTKKPFLIRGDSHDKALSGRLTKPDLFASVVVPIRRRQEVYGVLNVSCDKSIPVRFDESTLSFLSKAAGLAGVALERFGS